MNMSDNPRTKKPRIRVVIDNSEKNNVGYKKPPKHTQFQPGQSGNPKGRPRRPKLRDVRGGLRDAFLQSVSVKRGNRFERIPRIFMLIERAFHDASKGNQRALTFLYKVAGECGALDVKDEADLDLSMLSDKERKTCFRAWGILQKVRGGGGGDWLRRRR